MRTPNDTPAADSLAVCHACAYDLRGLGGPVCPECGTAAAVGRARAAAPSPRLFRTGQAGALLCGIAGASALLVAARAGAASGVWAGAACGSVGAAACGIATVWLVKRRELWRLPRHEQGRWATVVWIMLIAVLLVGMGTGAM